MQKTFFKFKNVHVAYADQYNFLRSNMHFLACSPQGNGSTVKLGTIKLLVIFT